VNSAILTDTGGMCVVDGPCEIGVPPAFQSNECQNCISETRASLISATAAACVISHFLMGMLGNLPLAVCPAMGLNAYFAYTVVGFMGTGRVKYNAALSAVFIEGFIFVIITLLGVRSKLVELIPRSVMLATSAGIGLFLAFIGMQSAEGIGVSTYNSATLVTLGGCPEQNRLYQYTIPQSAFDNMGSPDSLCVVDNSTTPPTVSSNGGLLVPSSTYSCVSAGVMRSATMWLGIAGGIIMAVAMAKNVKGAIIFGLLFVTFISWIPSDGNAARYIQKPNGCSPAGTNSNTGEPCAYTPAMRRWDYFKKVVSVPDTSQTAGKFDFSGFRDGDLWVALITFLYVDFLDATGTFYSMANFMSNFIPNFVDTKKKRFPRQTTAFLVDGVSISVGACLGTSPLTAFIESASGIREGARTGLAALTVSFYFFIALFFSPLLATVPPYATGPALILVGALMIINILKIRWENVQEAVPAFLTMIAMPMTYSVAYGFIAGIFGWILINGSVFCINFVQSYFWPKSEDPTLTRMATWKIARQMTFHLHDDDEEEGSDAGAKMDKPGGSATEEVEPAAAKV
jgi:AGZA family xanthine/uracil permease-like MFS transporter